VDSPVIIRPLLALLLLCGSAAAAGTVSGPATVIDGDTIEVQGTRIHLYGIDAPETAQSCETAKGLEYRCGREAAQALRARIGGDTVTCDRREGAAAGRVTGLCHVRGEDLSAWMVGQGLALASRHVTAAYVRQEGHAWATRRGIWAGTFEKPADWRQDRRRVEASAGTGAAD
jgi:endonuclease YncB( thermonuclease family)